jgi:hypothetical protein
MNLLVIRICQADVVTSNALFEREDLRELMLFERAAVAGFCDYDQCRAQSCSIVSSVSIGRATTHATRCRCNAFDFATWWKIGFIYVEKLSKRCCISFRLLYNYVIGCCSFEESDPTSLVTCHE